MAKITMKIEKEIEKEIDLKEIESLFITAIEGGINYWAMFDQEEIDLVRELYETSNMAMSEKMFDYLTTRPDDFLKLYDVEDDDEEPEVLGKISFKSMQDGLVLMAKEQNDHFNDFMNEQYDATTADVWFQLSVMQQIVYG